MLIINSADRPLSEALRLMYEEGISSVAVVDNHFNVVGNISATDVKVCAYVLMFLTSLTGVAFDPILVTPPPTQHVHSFRLGGLVYTRFD